MAIPTLRDDVAVSIASYGNSCMVYPEPIAGKSSNFELKQNLLMRLPVFHDLPTEEPNQHLSRFVTIVECMGPDMADPQILKMKAFPFSLDGAALDWFEDLPMGVITSWEKLVHEFLQKFYPATRVISMRSQIARIQQYATETYAEYYARFQKLQKRCPQHGFSKGSLLHFFYQGLNEYERRLLDSSARGAFIDMSHDAAEQLIAKRAANELQYGSRARSESILGIESDQRLTKIEQNLERLSALMQIGRTPQIQVCDFCATPRHSTESCPSFSYGNQEANHFLDTYNSRMGDLMRYEDTNGALYGFQFRDNSPHSGFQRTGPLHQNSTSGSNIEKLLAKLVEGQLEMQNQCSKDSQGIKKVQTQLGDVGNNVNQKHEFVEIHETTQPRPRFEHVNVITTYKSLGEGSSISQVSDILDEPDRDSNLQNNNEEVVETVPKERSPNFSYPVDFKSRFHRVPFLSHLSLSASI